MLKVVGGKIKDEKDFYLKWDTNLTISEEAARITRYSQTRMDREGVEPDGVLPTIISWLDSADYIIGHNILGFDIYLIREFYKYMGKDYKHLMEKLVDTNCVAKGMKFGLFYRRGEDLLSYQYKMMHKRVKGVRSSLVFLGKEFEIKHDYENLHNALVDLKLNLKVWDKLKWHIEI
jgi:DNA polymerase III epsilon subunit-like protein